VLHMSYQNIISQIFLCEFISLVGEVEFCEMIMEHVINEAVHGFSFVFTCYSSFRMSTSLLFMRSTGVPLGSV